MIAATILLGPGAEDTAPDAIRSVLGQVDGFILIDGGGGPKAIKACKDAIGGKAEVWTREYKWRCDYGDARNFALAMAYQCSAEWALTLDADERLYVTDLRYQLDQDPDCNVWVCRFRDRHGYHKPRAIRVSAFRGGSPEGVIQWNGLVHEELQGIEYQRVLDGYFDELGKDPEGYEARARRGVDLMPEMIRREPDKARWRRHLGECWLELGDTVKAYEAFEQMLSVAENRTEKGWALYRILEIEIAGGGCPWPRLCQALVDYPDFIHEFGWLACHLAQLDKDWSKAYHWAKIVTQCEVPFSRLCGHQSKTALPGCKAALEKIEAACAAKIGEMNAEHVRTA